MNLSNFKKETRYYLLINLNVSSDILFRTMCTYNYTNAYMCLYIYTLLYGCMDREFDRRESLGETTADRSLPDAIPHSRSHFSLSIFNAPLSRIIL